MYSLQLLDYARAPQKNKSTQKLAISSQTIMQLEKDKENMFSCQFVVPEMKCSEMKINPPFCEMTGDFMRDS